MTVRISRSLLAELIGRAAGQDVEICGLLLGGADRIAGHVPSTNVAPDPRRHFEVDPAVLIAAHRAARTGGAAAVIGHYHSHPTGLASPSMTDAQAARADGALWLIIGGDGARLWQAGDGGLWGRFTELALCAE
ncbi:M67 family metallopeptidase [Sphingobium aquiterrae]|uniref:M67 family metallopeptidase n=1 Tax=Sphingobium aquiterrae TaxID=2038656 RepID=UPI003016930D